MRSHEKSKLSGSAAASEHEPGRGPHGLMYPSGHSARWLYSGLFNQRSRWPNRFWHGVSAMKRTAQRASSSASSSKVNGDASPQAASCPA